eukprot:g2320.t1
MSMAAHPDDTQEKNDFVDLTHDPIDVAQLYGKVLSSAAGAVASFVGITRDNDGGKEVTKLEYEAYAPMAVKTMNEVCGEIRQRWPDICHAAIVHRLGVVDISEASIAIFVSSPHRKASLAAVQYAIDELKARLPVWKKEFYVSSENGPSWKANKEANLHVAGPTACK